MPKSPPEMTPAEFKLMKALWAIKRGTVADVRAEHNRRYGAELAYTTVMTLLGRLAGKHAVKVDKTRQPYLYRPAFQRESVLRDRLKRFVETVFDGRADSLVLHLVDSESLSLEELRDIERAIHESEHRDAERAGPAATVGALALAGAPALAGDADAADGEAHAGSASGATAGALALAGAPALAGDADAGERAAGERAVSGDDAGEDAGAVAAGPEDDR